MLGVALSSDAAASSDTKYIQSLKILGFLFEQKRRGKEKRKEKKRKKEPPPILELYKHDGFPSYFHFDPSSHHHMK